jgi:hypothetical protein
MFSSTVCEPTGTSSVSGPIGTPSVALANCSVMAPEKAPLSWKTAVVVGGTLDAGRLGDSHAYWNGSVTFASLLLADEDDVAAHRGDSSAGHAALGTTRSRAAQRRQAKPAGGTS